MRLPLSALRSRDSHARGESCLLFFLWAGARRAQEEKKRKAEERRKRREERARKRQEYEERIHKMAEEELEDLKVGFSFLESVVSLLILIFSVFSLPFFPPGAPAGERACAALNSSGENQ